MLLIEIMAGIPTCTPIKASARGIDASTSCTWTGAHKGHAFFAYADNYLMI
jgi:hypothetical protein